MKIVIKYARDGAVRFLSHLDMQRAFGRAIRRADIDALYSQGFNPHILMSFASPLSVGYATQGDYLEVGASDEEDVSTICSRLNAVFTDDIRVLHAFLYTGKKKLMALNARAEYQIRFAVENEMDCVTIKDISERLGAAESYIREARRGKPVDIAPLLYRIEARGGDVACMLKNTNDGALNPAVPAQAILAELGKDLPYTICRLDCYAQIGGKYRPFTELEHTGDESGVSTD